MNVFIDGIIFGRQNFGGISRMWEEYLSRLPDYPIDLTLLAPWRCANQSLINLLKNKEKYRLVPDYFYWPARFFERVGVRSKLLKSLFLNNRTDIFHSTYFSTVYSKKIKKVVTVYDMIPEKFQNTHNNKWISWFIDIKRRVIINADQVVAISQHTKRDLLQFYPQVPENKVSVIHLACSVRHERLDTTIDDVARKYSIEIRPYKYFLFVGLRNGYKNFQIIIDTVKLHHDLLFICVGGEKNPDIYDRLKKMGLSRNFILLDYVNDETLSVLYENALAFVFPSLYEGFGLPILEAMTNKCPVICSNMSCFPEIAGDAALYFDPHSVDSFHEAITRLHQQDRDTLIEKGIKNTARFSWEKSTQALVDVYHSLL